MEWKINDLLQKMVQRGASDLLIKAGSRPGLRIDGLFKVYEDLDVVTPDVSKSLAFQMLKKKQWERFIKELDLEFSYAVKDLGRFRVNLLTQRNSLAIAVRHIPGRPQLTRVGS